MTFFSIITATKNSEKYINRCIKSIECQKFTDFNCVWIDGASNDSTLEILSKSSLNKKAIIISEPDNGLYYAFNKALDFCNAKFIIYLNSDDYLQSPNYLSDVHNIICSKNDVTWICAGIYFVDQRNKILRKWLPRLNYGIIDIHLGWMPPHSCSVVSNTIMRDLRFDTKYKISADYDLFLRYVKKYGVKQIFCLKEYSLIQQIGGASNGSLYKFFVRFIEDYRARYYFSKFTFVLSFLKPFRKINQFVNF